MSFFDALFGTPSPYSQEEYQLSDLEVKQLVSRDRINTLDATQEKLIERAVLDRRKGDGKISLRQIHELLRSLRFKHLISEFDEKKTMAVFEEFFAMQRGEMPPIV